MANESKSESSGAISLSVLLNLFPMKRVWAFLAALPPPSLWLGSSGPQVVCGRTFSADAVRCEASERNLECRLRWTEELFVPPSGAHLYSSCYPAFRLRIRSPSDWANFATRLAALVELKIRCVVALKSIVAIGLPRCARGKEKLRLLSLHPLRLEFGIGQPLDRSEHGMDSFLHMDEVNVGDVVAGTVVVRVKAKTRHGMGDDALFGQGVIVGSLEEVLFGMRICHQPGAMFRQFRAEIAAIETSEPEFIGFNSRVWAANHFKFQVGDNVFERHLRMFKEIPVALASGLLAAEEHKENSAFWRLFVRQGPRQLQHGDTSGSVIVGAVVNVISVDRLADAKVVHMCREKNDLVLQFLVTARDSAEHVAGIPLLFSFSIELELAGDVLNIAAFVAGRLDPDFAQL